MDSLRFLATSLLGLFALLCIYYLVCRKQRSTKMKEAPKAAGAWPIIGHLHLLARGDLPHTTLAAMADKYGTAFNIRLGVHRAMVVSNWEIAKECFTTNDRVLASSPTTLAIKLMGYNYAMFAFAPYGSYWRKMRKIVMLEILSSTRIESLKHIWDSEISTSIKELYQMWEKQNNAQGPVLVEMKQWFGDMTLNVMVRMVVGKRYFGASADCDANESRRCQKAVRNFFRLVGTFVVSDALPFLGWLDLQGHQKDMKSTAKEVDSILQVWLDEHKSKKVSCPDEEHQDFMDVMLSILQDTKFTEYDIDTINKATCFTMILAGSDSSMVTLTWALSLLLNNPHVLKKAQYELDIHVGRDRNVEESDVRNLVYLQAIVKETFRLYPPVPLLAAREASEDCTIAGYDVRAGTHILVNTWKLQRDPSVWSDPCEFQPERFLSIDTDVKGQHFELIPFGTGRRACAGISFALNIVWLSLARLLHGFELTIPSGSNIDMTESVGLVNAKQTPLEVLISPRLSPELYV